jgi:3-dehydroquinate synthase
MPVLPITLPRADYHYDLVVESGLLQASASLEAIKRVLPQPCKLLIVTHAPLWHLHGQVFLQHLQAAGYTPTVFTVAEGETSKQWQTLQAVWSAAQSAGLTRSDAFIAFGGGVVGDLTGFAAATYYRGVPFIQVPTTLLAQIDSSVGGKTGINLPQVKNGVGVFNQPRLVLIDPAVLATLPPRELTAGLGEMVKYALIEHSCGAAPTGDEATPTLWPTLWQQLSAFADRQALLPLLPELIMACCRIKAAVVCQDEFEQTGQRALLNLGHTFAHALEADGHYTTYLHGEAVAIGMWWACCLSHQQGQFTRLAEVNALWQALALPLQPFTAHSADNLLARMQQDKKNRSTDAITLILPLDTPDHPLGHAVKTDTTPLSTLKTLLEGWLNEPSFDEPNVNSV